MAAFFEMTWLILMLFCALVSLGKADGNYTFSYHTALQCKEHVCNHGYKYETFYRIDSEDRRQIETASNVQLEMHIAILGASNGHILLSTLPNPNGSEPVYEIVNSPNEAREQSSLNSVGMSTAKYLSMIAAELSQTTALVYKLLNGYYIVGGGGNKFTELRRNLRRNAKHSVPSVGILSVVEFRPFYIRIGKDGLMQFGKEGEPPLLNYLDVNPIAVQYFSFAAWNGVEIKFLYDCPANGSNSSTTDSKAVERPMSNSEKLKATLLLDRLPHLPPGPQVEVRLGLKVTSVNYNPFDSRLVTGVAGLVSWVDDSMAWDPYKFNNITRLTFHDGQIWRPTFFVFNADGKGAVNTENPGPTTMVNSGEATFYFQAELTTWCYEYAKTVNKWPHDEYRCTVLLGPWEAHEKIIIEEISLKDEKMAIFADLAQLNPNEWQVAFEKRVMTPARWHTMFKANDNETYQSDRFLMNITLKRQAMAYNLVFYTPLTVLVLFMLMSFWGEPLQMARVWFYAGAAIVICIGLCYIDYMVPCHVVPTILVLYVTVMSGFLMALLTQALLMTDVAEKLCKSTPVHSLLSARVFRIIFFLPALKNAINYDMINEAYSQEDDESGIIAAPRNGNIEEMDTEKVEYGEREELASVIDKVLFVVYSVVFAVMLAEHF